MSFLTYSKQEVKFQICIQRSTFSLPYKDQCLNTSQVLLSLPYLQGIIIYCALAFPETPLFVSYNVHLEFSYQHQLV
jgi:hypothetical protein